MPNKSATKYCLVPLWLNIFSSLKMKRRSIKTKTEQNRTEQNETNRIEHTVLWCAVVRWWHLVELKFVNHFGVAIWLYNEYLDILSYARGFAVCLYHRWWMTLFGIPIYLNLILALLEAFPQGLFNILLSSVFLYIFSQQ